MKEIGISSMILKTGLDIAKVCIGASVCGLGALYLGQRQLIYPRPNQIYDPKDAGAELLRIKQDESSVVSAAWFPPRDEDIEIFIYFHGNGDQIGAAGSFLATEFKRRYGFGFLAVEYPGYGLAQGQPSEKSIIHTANIALQHCIHELKIEPHRIILFGQSLGTGPALQLACSYHDIIPKLILLSPFTSIPAVAHSVFPFIPLSFLRVAIHDTFDNLKFMRSLSAIKRHDKKHPKCLILHGTEDEIVPFTQGQQLAAAGLAPLSSLTSSISPSSNQSRRNNGAISDFSFSTTFIPLRDLGHNNVFFDFYAHPNDSSPTSVIDIIARFASSSSSSSSSSIANVQSSE